MVLWLVFGSIFARLERVPELRASTSGSSPLGALLPLVLDAPFGAQAYAHTLLSAVLVLVLAMLRHDRARPPAAPAPRAQPRDRLVRGPRAQRRVDAQGSVLVARVRCRPSRTRRCSPPWPRRRRARDCSGSAAAWWIWTRFGLADPAPAPPAAGAPGRLAIVGAGSDDDRVRAARRRPPHNRDGRLQGRIDLALTERGRRPGRARSPTCSRRATITRVVASPLHRAPPRPRPRSPQSSWLRDRDRRAARRARLRRVGRPRARATIPPDEWAAWRADPRSPRPGGESLVHVDRTRRARSARAPGGERRPRRRGEPRLADQGRGVLGARRRRARRRGTCTSGSRPSRAIGRAPRRAAGYLAVVQRRRAPRRSSPTRDAGSTGAPGGRGRRSRRR